MQSAPERTLRISFWEWLRWACVLPAAIATGSAASYAIDILGIALRTIAPLALEYLWRFGIGHFMRDAATVFVGAVVAPRHQIITALVLTIAQSVLALKTHMLIEERVGYTNYIHFAAEVLGSVCGIMFLVATAHRRAIISVRRR